MPTIKPSAWPTAIVSLALIYLVSMSVIAQTNAIQNPVRWIRPATATNSLIWGIDGALQFALHPHGFTAGDGGPRGLIRIGYPTLSNGVYDLINFIAVEPIVNGRKG